MSQVSYGSVEGALQQKTAYSKLQSSRALSPFSSSIDARLFYEIDRSVERLAALWHRDAVRPLRVALQFPDDLLPDATLVTGMLQQATAARDLRAQFYVLGTIDFLYVL